VSVDALISDQLVSVIAIASRLGVCMNHH
jgi:hypothetical protein